MIVLMVVVAVGGVWLSWYLKKKRREELAGMARSLGLEYSSQDPYGLDSLPFELFGKGDGRGTENVLWGTWQGIDLKCFDYWYYERSTDSKGNTSRTYYRFSCAITELPIDSAHLTIEQENVLTRIGEHLGFHDIPFESEDFNRRFRVHCADPKFATDVIDARMMAWLLESRGFEFELNGPYLLCYCHRVRPTELVPVIGTLKMFKDHLPRVTLDLYGSSRGAEPEERTS